MARRRLDELEMEREFEEKVESKRRRQQSARDYPTYAQEPKRGRKKQKPPLLLRCLAWCGVIMFCFVVGYTGTGYLVEKFGLNEQIFNKQPETDSDGAAAQPSGVFTESEAAKFDIQKASFSVFYPRGGELVSENIEVIYRTMEDNMQEAARNVLRLGGMDEAVDVLHVFRDVDTVYLDLSSAFPGALAQAGKEAATLLINGIVRTMDENFELPKVRFLVDSKLASQSNPVDLSAVWQIQR